MPCFPSTPCAEKPIKRGCFTLLFLNLINLRNKRSAFYLLVAISNVLLLWIQLFEYLMLINTNLNNKKKKNLFISFVLKFSFSKNLYRCSMGIQRQHISCYRLLSSYWILLKVVDEIWH